MKISLTRKILLLNYAIRIAALIGLLDSAYYFYAKWTIETALKKGNILAIFALEIYFYLWVIAGISILTAVVLAIVRYWLIKREDALSASLNK
jgi:hypothetical protein